MNVQRIMAMLAERFPGKAVVCLPHDAPTEIRCELEPAANHKHFSITLAVIDSTRPHLHKRTTETYEVLRGTIALWVDNRPIAMKTGESRTVPPGAVHFATGSEAWVKIRSEPGWTANDHYLV